MTITLTQIHRYPVKGLSAQPLDRIDLVAGAAMPDDRRFAIAHGASAFDPAAPAWQPKRQFLMLMEHERLATLRSHYDPETGTLVILRDGKPVARGVVTTPLGQDLINQFFAAYLKEESLGMPRIVEAPGVAFTDSPDPVLSIINLASVRDLERVARQPVDPLRFRGNLLIDGAEPWSEHAWVGQTVSLGGVRLHVTEVIGRCAATTVNPDTAERDLNVPKILRAGFGHVYCGVYVRVMDGGPVAVGDELTGLWA